MTTFGWIQRVAEDFETIFVFFQLPPICRFFILCLAFYLVWSRVVLFFDLLQELLDKWIVHDCVQWKAAFSEEVLAHINDIFNLQGDELG